MPGGLHAPTSSDAQRSAGSASHLKSSESPLVVDGVEHVGGSPKGSCLVCPALEPEVNPQFSAEDGRVQPQLSLDRGCAALENSTSASSSVVFKSDERVPHRVVLNKLLILEC